MRKFSIKAIKYAALLCLFALPAQLQAEQADIVNAAQQNTAMLAGKVYPIDPASGEPIAPASVAEEIKQKNQEKAENFAAKEKEREDSLKFSNQSQECNCPICGAPEVHSWGSCSDCGRPNPECDSFTCACKLKCPSCGGDGYCDEYNCSNCEESHFNCEPCPN